MSCADTLKAMICSPFVMFHRNIQFACGGGCFLGRTVLRKETPASSLTGDLSKQEMVVGDGNRTAINAADFVNLTKPRGRYGVQSPLLAERRDDAPLSNTAGDEREDSYVAYLHTFVAAKKSPQQPGLSGGAQTESARFPSVKTTKAAIHDTDQSIDATPAPTRTYEPFAANERDSLVANWGVDSNNGTIDLATRAPNELKIASDTSSARKRKMMPSVIYGANPLNTDAHTTDDMVNKQQVRRDSELISELDI